MRRPHFDQATAGLREARRALLDRAAREALRRDLGALLGDRFRLGRCRLRRTKLKPGRKLSAYLDVGVADHSGAPVATRAVAVEWVAQLPTLTGDASRLEREAARRGVGAPFASLCAELPEEGVRILVAPLDVRFPQLVRLADPSYAASLIPGAHRPPSVATMRYRPGQRHVLRYDLSDEGAAFAKLYVDDAGRRAGLVGEAVADAVARLPALGATRPLAYLSPDRTLLTPAVAGAPLSRRTAGGGAARRLRRAGELLAALHRAPPEERWALVARDLDDEVAATSRACEHIAALLPSVAAAAAEVLQRAREVYARVPGGETTLVHGDFKLDHLWASRDRLTIIDFDSARVADPALDVGKLLADLSLWLAGDANALQVARAAFIDGYGAPQRSDVVRRARAWESVWLVKAAARRISILDPAWEARVASIVGRAAASVAP
jgi:hypothetical protein